MFATERSAALEEALGPGSPIVVFDKVSLAFDDNVILRNISFTVITGHTKIILGASGSGKCCDRTRASSGSTANESTR